MSLLSFIVAIIFIALVMTTGLILYFSKKFKEMTLGKDNNQSLQFLNQNIQAMNQQFSEKMDRTTSAMNERLDTAAKVIMAVNSELGQMKEIGSNLKNIQDFMRSPKLRGNLGEQGLKELLSQGLPTRYFDIQYTFRSGLTVDAIIHLEAGKIPIDAKFPFENFNLMLKSDKSEDKAAARRAFRNDFRRHVNAISSKYINQDEGTSDFAFMYIPSESIYFEVINNESDLFEYAAEAHVVLSSPSTFFYYLRTIMLGLESKRVTEMSHEILKTLKTVKLQSNLLGDNLGILTRHIGNSSKTISAVNDQFARLAEKVDRIDLLEEKEEERLLNEKS
ncbi:MAG: DNA recombination protein RmuC [Candidatus Berkelbacteria bacterium]|nr:DNA recombination protein RmuC [Candidatus Berkelbacteria bacterium]